ncbi:MAG TPA: YraN family protein [Anaeromyxobacteraceae bacterium]|nr:YraN family protein [Anaeromyxobacteraceae bacterium]
MKGPPAGSPGQRGREAEAAAARWLEGQGFEVLARNHATRRGEVDLVCREGDTLCFVEVRSRAAGGLLDPVETVTRRKARRVVLAAADWAARHGALERPMRFDLLAVRLGPGGAEFELLRNAFDASGAPGVFS